jgi:glycosyltransferase involved in cell wall biosynthesis
MSVLYLLTSPKPGIEGTDAVFQEVATLKAAFNGEVLNLCPRKVPGAPFPPQLFGFHTILDIWKSEKRCQLNHLYFSVPYFFPVLNFLRNPVVFSVTASLANRPKPSNIRGLNSLHRVVVTSERDAGILKSWGLSNSAVVPPGIDTSRVVPDALPMKDEVTVLMASAPWVEEQLDSKGVEVLLDGVASVPTLRLILLWRGHLLQELLARIDRRGIGDRVEVVSHHVNVNHYLKKAHAAVLLAKRGDIVKAYPHSLIEALLAGKPVILTDALPMADYVRHNRCGIVLDEVGTGPFIAAVDALRNRYGELARNARRIDSHAFSEQAMIEGYRYLYRLGVT